MKKFYVSAIDGPKKYLFATRKQDYQPMNMFNTKTIDRQAAQALGSPGERTEWQDALCKPPEPKSEPPVMLWLFGVIGSVFAIILLITALLAVLFCASEIP